MPIPRHAFALRRSAEWILLFLLSAGACISARAEDFFVTATSVATTTERLQSEGVDWMFLPYRQPFDPKHPQVLPFDQDRNQRGVITSAQMRVLSRVLAPVRQISRVLAPGQWLALARADGTEGPAFAVACEGLPGNKVRISSHAGGRGVEEGVMESGQTLIFSTAGKNTGGVNIYLVTVKRN